MNNTEPIKKFDKKKKVEKIKEFTDLHAWQEAHQLVLSIYIHTREFPQDEKFGLISQMRRAAVSVTSNIAEGFSRRTYKEKVRFYYMAMGSITELQNQCIVAKDVEYFSPKQFETLYKQTRKVHKITNGLIKSSQQKSRGS